MSRLRHDYRKVRPVVDALHGLDELEAVEKQVADITLPACPFCGGEAVVGLHVMYCIPGAAVECTQCNSRTMVCFSGLDVLTQKLVTIQEAISEAAKRWSRRRTA